MHIRISRKFDGLIYLKTIIEYLELSHPLEPRIQQDEEKNTYYYIRVHTIPLNLKSLMSVIEFNEYLSIPKIKLPGIYRNVSTSNQESHAIK